MIEKWTINGKELTYEEEKHRYTYDGKECLSVTTFLSKYLFKGMYDDIPPEILESAKKRGTYVHESIEFYEKYGIENDELIEFKNYLFLKNYYKFNIVENEVPLVFEYKGFYLCGRTDLILNYDDKLVVADIKTTSSLHTDYLEYQLSLYALGYKYSYGKEIEKLYAIWINKRGSRQFVEIKNIENIVKEKLEKYLEEIKNE